MYQLQRSLQGEVRSRARGATLPIELLQLVYLSLRPGDFNAARHTCRQWMLASLDLGLLGEQLKRGGWWTTASTQSALWRRSCCLARECVLAGSWTGNGLAIHSEVREENGGQTRHNPMVASTQVDFSSLLEACIGRSGVTRSVCTTSPCGKYYITTSGSEIYIYEIEGLYMRLLSSLSCDSVVKAVALHTSEECFAIAAVLEGRTGLYVDLLSKSVLSTLSEPWKSAGALRNRSSTTAPVMDFGSNHSAAPSDMSNVVAAGDSAALSISTPWAGETSIIHQSVELMDKRTWSQCCRDRRARLRNRRQVSILSPGVSPGALNLSTERMGDQASYLQIAYRNLCLEEDPPYSVAISPTRQCVAFGCQSGVELYWIDPTTGQCLNRWFPLHRPSDHLYFLPPRVGIDSHLRLRLISSSNYARPYGEATSAHGSQRLPFWSTLASPLRFIATQAARDDGSALPDNGIAANHSRGIPLADGHHILFTDNGSGRLCLGCDMPASSTQRLSRKFVFVHTTSSLFSTPPTVYAASADLENGVRIAAAYGNEVLIYSVPIDALRYSKAEQEQTILDPSVPFEELRWLNLMKHPTSNAAAFNAAAAGEAVDVERRMERLNMAWVHYLPAFDAGRVDSLDRLWPLRISGTRVGTFEGVRALAVQEDSVDGLVVWAFGHEMAIAWKVDDGRRPVIYYSYCVYEDGLVSEE